MAGSVQARAPAKARSAAEAETAISLFKGSSPDLRRAAAITDSDASWMQDHAE